MTKEISAESLMRSTWEKVRDLSDKQIEDLLRANAGDEVDLKMAVYRIKEWGKTGILPDIPTTHYKM